MDQELREFLEQKFTAIDQRFEATSARLDRLQGAMDEKTQETRRHFEVVGERLESRIQLVAEGVAGVNERLDRELPALRREIAQGNQEILAVVRFSYAELDRRVRALEDEVTVLRGRIERLEAGLG